MFSYNKNRQAGGSRLTLYFVLLAGSFLFLCGIILAVSMKKGDSGATPEAVSVSQPAPAAQMQVALQKPTAVPMVEVIVPVRDIPQGEALQVSYFAKVSRPANNVPQNCVRSYDELRGQFARSTLRALEPVSYNLITREQPINIVADSIPKGFRAVTINVNATTGVEGWASPGAQVDVHWISDALGERTATLLVQNAKVLSAERQVDAANQDPARPIPTTVTLLASERDAQKISLAAAAGTLVLHLRGVEGSGKASGSPSVLSLKRVAKGESDDALRRGRIQGRAKITREDGTVDEFAVIDGKLMNKVN